MKLAISSSIIIGLKVYLSHTISLYL